MSFSYSDLTKAVAEDAAFRRRRRLQPAGGPGDKLFPPTYPGEGDRNAPPQHVFERRRIGEAERWCVLIDSVQAQANRQEEALLAAAQAGRLALPRLVVDFAASGLNSLGDISTLEAPHRVFDAIFRDSLHDGKPFQDSALGQKLKTTTAKDASALLELSPTALLFGVWHSTGEGGGLGVKFPRALVSEIIGVDVPVEDKPPEGRERFASVRTAARRTGSRIDPLGVLRAVEVYKGEKGWDTTEKAAGKGAKKVRPSEINHGNVAPSVQPLGITCAYAEQTAVLTLAGLRRVRFGGAAERDTAARSLIAALGLVALLEQDVQGYALRSRCDLVCEGAAPLERVAFDGTVKTVELTRDQAVALYQEAYAKARAQGFELVDEPVRLEPQPKLVHIVRESQHRALRDEGGEAEGTG